MADANPLVQAGTDALAKKAAKEVLKYAGFAEGSAILSAWGAVMNWVDGENRKRLDEVRKHEGCPHVEACAGLSCAGDHYTKALAAAQLGWTAWLAPNGLYVFH